VNGYRVVTHQKAIHKTWPLPFIPNELTKTIVPFIRSALRSPEVIDRAKSVSSLQSPDFDLAPAAQGRGEILAKKRHPPCRFTSLQRKCLAAFLALPLCHRLQAP